MKMKNKTLFILSTIFTVLALIGFVLSMIYAVAYFIELATPEQPCVDPSQVCIQLKGEPFIMIVYLIFGIATVIVSLIGFILASISKKANKVALIEFIANLAMILIVISIFIVMLLTVN